MDVLALTSAQPEPFGNVVMEAMGMGLPVVATNIGGSLDQVLDGITGFLVPPADPEALAGAIEKLMKNPELRQQMGAAAMGRLQKNFSLAEMTQKIEQVFNEAINNRKT
jgi:glycosyltransferase involved in cell wall biosynthesis